MQDSEQKIYSKAQIIFSAFICNFVSAGILLHLSLLKAGKKNEAENYMFLFLFLGLLVYIGCHLYLRFFYDTPAFIVCLGIFQAIVTGLLVSRKKIKEIIKKENSGGFALWVKSLLITVVIYLIGSFVDARIISILKL